MHFEASERCHLYEMSIFTGADWKFLFKAEVAVLRTVQSSLPRGITCATRALSGREPQELSLCFSTQFPKAYIWTYRLYRAAYWGGEGYGR
jgi:hypothetical protein